MAELKFCPNCKTSREVTKKGFNKNGEQLYFCKTCGKKFVPTKATSADAKVASAKVKAPKETKVTEIVVNSNTVKTVPGTLTVDAAFELVSSYFREIVKEKVDISDRDNKRTIKFKVTTGTKA